METAAIGIEAPSKRKVRAVIPAQYLVGVVFKKLNLHTRRGFKRLTLSGFKAIGWIGHKLHGRYGAALPTRCQLPFPGLAWRPVSLTTRTSSVRFLAASEGRVYVRPSCIAGQPGPAP
jgi:hypothetical protein